MTSEVIARLRRYSQGLAAVIGWAASAVFTLITLWQVCVGWPLSRSVPIKFEELNALDPRTYRVKLPKDALRIPWNSSLTRAWLDGRELPAYLARTSKKTGDELTAAWAGGSLPKENTVVFRPADGQPAPTAENVQVRIPWLPSRWLLQLAPLATAAGAWWLTRVRNASFLHLCGRLTAVPWVPLLLAIACAGALLFRIYGLHFPVLQPDSPGYLNPGYQLVTGQTMEVTDRTLGYSVLAGLILRTTQSLLSIVKAQWIASLIGSAGLALVLLLASRRLFEAGWARLLMQLSAVAGFALFAFHEGIVQREWDIMPEASTAAYFGFQFWLVWQMTSQPHRLGPLLVCFCALCFFGWLTFLTKPNWGLALGFLALPWVVASLRSAGSPPELRKFLASGAAVFLAFAAFAWGLQQLTPTNSIVSMEIRARVLVVWHLDMTQPEVNRQLLREQEPRRAALLQELAAVMAEERALARQKGCGAYPMLGYDADRLFYHGFAKALLFRKLTLPERTRFCRELFLASLKSDPGAYVRHVARQMTNLIKRPYGPSAIYLPGVWKALATAYRIGEAERQVLPGPMIDRYNAELDAGQAILAGPWPSPARFALSRRVTLAFAALTKAFAWSIALPGLLVGLVAAVPSLRRRIAWAVAAPVVTLGVWAAGSMTASALTSSLAQALEIQRYIDLFLPVTLLAQLIWPFMGLAFLLAIVMERGPLSCTSEPSTWSAPKRESATGDPPGPV